MPDFDVLLIGAGQAAVPLAPKLARDGLRVAVAEQAHVGGSCVNVGCMPSKAVHAAARVAHLARNAGRWGIRVGTVEPDLAAVLEAGLRHTHDARGNIEQSFADADVTLLRGRATLVGGDGGFKVDLAGRTVTAGRIVIDVGSRTHLPDIPGIAEVQPVTSENWTTRHDVGRRLVILGGGYIGVEMAQFYRRMVRDVTLVHDGSEVLDHEDADTARIVRNALEREGVRFVLGAKATRVADGGLSLDGREPVPFDTLFVATGRTPRTRDLGLDTLGVTPDDKGAVPCDAYGEADGCPGLFVCGDARGGPAFTHTAHDDHHILLGRLRGRRDPGGSEARDARLVPWAVFTDPELGRVGKSEADAPGARIIRVPMATNDRARITGEPEGIVKIVLDPDDPRGRLLGACVVGPHAGEIVHAFVMLMHLDKRLLDLHDAVFIHPTIFEVVHQAVDAFARESGAAT